MEAQSILLVNKEVVDDWLTCSICFNEFDDVSRKPKFLPCAHTFCFQCVQSIFQEKTKTISCPLCRDSHKSSRDPTDLPNNPFVQHMLKMNNLTTKDTPSPGLSMNECISPPALPSLSSNVGLQSSAQPVSSIGEGSAYRPSCIVLMPNNAGRVGVSSIITRQISSFPPKCFPCIFRVSDNAEGVRFRMMALPGQSCLVDMPNNTGQVEVHITMEPGESSTCIVNMPGNMGQASIYIVSAASGRPCTVRLPNNQGKVDIRLGETRGQPCDIHLPNNTGQINISVNPSRDDEEPCIIHLPNNEGDVDLQCERTIQKG